MLAISKKTWADIECKGCKQKQRVLCEIPDARAVAGALKDLLAEGFGRPKDEPDDGDKITVIRKVIYEGNAPDA